MATAVEERSPSMTTGITSQGTHLVRLGPPASGDVIHTSECRYAWQHSNPLRWLWADRIGFENIDWDALRRHGIRPCRVCHPEQVRTK